MGISYSTCYRNSHATYSRFNSGFAARSSGARGHQLEVIVHQAWTLHGLKMSTTLSSRETFHQL
ncbi:hypothetical protein T439DRAFT_329731 [Meredithblackwellia eburnea MCA 4105]